MATTQRPEAQRPLPQADASELEWLLFRQDGVISRRQALEFLSRRVIYRRLATKRWSAVHRGIYLTHGGVLTPHQYLWMCSLAAGAGRPALVGGLSALGILGLQRFDSRAVHLLLPADRRDHDPPPGVVVHRTRHLPDSDIHATGNPPCTRVARSVVDAAQWARSNDEARTIIAMAIQQRLVTGERILDTLHQMPRVRRHALIRRTANDARDGSHTLTELDLAAICRAHGLPEPTRQVYRRDRKGRVRYLDAYFEEWRLRIEVDGAYHMSADEWWRDMDRHNALANRDEVLLRFPAWLVREHPAEVGQRLREALLEAGWRPD